MAVPSLQHTSPDARRKQIERQLELDAALVAKQAAQQHLQKRLPMPAGGGTTPVPPTPPMGALPLPGPMAQSSPSLAPMAQPATPPAPAFTDPAQDPSIPPPTPPAMAGGTMTPPALPGFAEGGQIPDELTRPPRVISAEEILEFIARQANGEQLDPQAIAQQMLEASEPAMEADVPAPDPDLPPPPPAFIDWLNNTAPEATTEFGRLLLDTYAQNPEQVATLWELVQEFAQAPDDGGGDELPPELLRLAGGRSVAAKPQKPPLPEPMPGKRPLPLPA